MSDEERRKRLTLRRLKKLNEDWPRAWTLFGHSGLCVLLKSHEDVTAYIERGDDTNAVYFGNIQCDGGDP